MASEQDKLEERTKQTQQMKMRRALDAAYGALEGQKCIQSFTTYSFEEALDQQIEAISGTGSRLRPNELDRVERIRQDLVTAVASIKEVPPEAFLPKSEGRDVNT